MIKISDDTKKKAMTSVIGLLENERIYSEEKRAAKLRNAILVVREIIKDYSLAATESSI